MPSKYANIGQCIVCIMRAQWSNNDRVIAHLKEPDTDKLESHAIAWTVTAYPS